MTNTKRIFVSFIALTLLIWSFGLALPAKAQNGTFNLEGKVLLPDGVTPVANTWVNVKKIISVWEKWWVDGAHTDANGTFKFNLSEAGAYELRLEVPEDLQSVYAPSTYTFDLGADLITVTNLKDAGGNDAVLTALKLTDPSISGLIVFVKDPDENPAQGVWMGLRQE